MTFQAQAEAREDVLILKLFFIVLFQCSAHNAFQGQTLFCEFRKVQSLIRMVGSVTFSFLFKTQLYELRTVVMIKVYFCFVAVSSVNVTIFMSS